MGSYSIKELETLSGIKAHTIRIWEKRHQLIVPNRTTTNIRYYSDDDLKKIINVSLLNSHGVKISKIAEMSDHEIQSQIIQLTESKSEVDLFIDQLIISMIDMEEELFEKKLSHLIIKFGFEKTVTEIIYPFLEKIGVLWQTGNINPAQEHFISNLIRQKIIVAIDSLPFPSKGATRVILFLPENELHDIALLFYTYILKSSGFKTYYLGQHLPFADLKTVCEIHKPKYLITSLTISSKPQRTSHYIQSILDQIPDCQLLTSGHFATKLDIKSPKLSHFSTPNALKALIEV